MRKSLAVVLALALCSVTLPIRGGELHVDLSKPNLVKFISDAPIEDFEGTTDRIDGYVYWNDKDTLGDNEIYMEVDLNSLDTGIGLRNRHMREKYLETERYPRAIFRGTFTLQRQQNDDTLQALVKGTMRIHGVERAFETPVTVIRLPDRFRAESSFTIRLADFRIKIPKFMFMKISENVAVELRVYLKAVPEAQE